MSLLGRLEALALRLTREPAPVDPARFNDPLALKTPWTPASSGGSNFRTHHLVQRSPDRVEFRGRLGGPILFFAIFGLFFVGIPVSGGGIVGGLMGLVFAVFFLGIGAFVLVHAFRPVVFDRTRGEFWVGWQQPVPGTPAAADRSCRIADVHALQIVKERVRGNKSSYWSYELNLVLKDARRLTVVDHGALEALRADAAELARLLNCKLWDATVEPGVAAVPAGSAPRPSTPSAHVVTGLLVIVAGVVIWAATQSGPWDPRCLVAVQAALANPSAAGDLLAAYVSEGGKALPTAFGAIAALLGGIRLLYGVLAALFRRATPPDPLVPRA